MIYHTVIYQASPSCELWDIGDVPIIYDCRLLDFFLPRFQNFPIRSHRVGLTCLSKFVAYFTYESWMWIEAMCSGGQYTVSQVTTDDGQPQ